MKFIQFILLALLCTACSTTNFHRQKYTNFGHVRGTRLIAHEKKTSEKPVIIPETTQTGFVEEQQPEAVVCLGSDSVVVIPVIESKALVLADEYIVDEDSDAVAAEQEEPVIRQETVQASDPVETGPDGHKFEKTIKIMTIINGLLFLFVTVFFTVAILSGSGTLIAFAGLAGLALFILLLVAIIVGVEYRRVQKKRGATINERTVTHTRTNGLLLVWLLLLPIVVLIILLLFTL